MNINQILRANPRNITYGAPRGARSYHDAPKNTRLYLQRLVLVDGGYGADGAYWGGGRDTQPLWCAFDGPQLDTHIVVRAANRQAAIDSIRRNFPGVVFKRGA